MSKYKNIGVVTPAIELEVVFCEKGKLVRNPVIALLITEYSDKEGKSTMVEPLSFDKKWGIINALEIGSYLGIEEKGKEIDWTEEIEEIRPDK